jgi:hypothetical protein
MSALGGAPYLMNDRNVEIEGLLSALSVPPLGIFEFITEYQI